MKNFSISPEEAAVELLRRRRARANLVDFAKAIEVPGRPISDSDDEWVFKPVETGIADHHLLIMTVMQRVMTGDLPRAMFFLPPGSAKSTYGSVVAPTWAMGLNPGIKIILASYGSDLARRHGRRARQIVKSEQYQAICGTKLSSDTAAADEWALTNGSEYTACGVLSGITGHRAHGIIIDDPIKGRQEAESETIRERTWNTYCEDLRTRLVPGGWEMIIQCMTGDTRVLMADGTQKTLKNIQVGDKIATYDKGHIRESVVRNWKNQGLDIVLAIKMKSGIIVKANERHPFLVRRNGEPEWVRLRELRVNDKMTCLMELGAESNVLLMDVNNQQGVKDCATSITPRTDGTKGLDHPPVITSHDELRIFATDMGLKLSSTQQRSNCKEESALSANDHQHGKTPAPERDRIYVSTTTIAQERLEDCFVTIATSPSGVSEHPNTLRSPLSIYEVGEDEIVSITPAGMEDVFDIEVADTANFIANGCVASNTRWHEDDIAGRILPENYEGENGLIRCRDGRDWYIICLPAQCERADDPIGRKIGDYLWPEWFSEGHFAPFKTNTRTWNALFQQRPQPDEGTFFQRSWFKRFTKKDLPEFLHVYGSSDYAVSESKNDFTEHGVVGVDPDGDLWIMDWWYGQTEADVWIEKQLDMVKAYQPFCWFEEGGVIKRAIRPFLERRMQERNIYCRHEWIPKTADKTISARGFQARASAGKVHIPEGELGDRLIDQFIRFPTAAHDDAVDVLTTFCMALDQAHPAIAHSRPAVRLQSDRRIDFIERPPVQDYEHYAAREHSIDDIYHQRVAAVMAGDELEEGEIPRDTGRLIHDLG